MRETVTTIGELAGAGLFIAGIVIAYGVAAGLIVGGVIFIVLSWLVSA